VSKKKANGWLTTKINNGKAAVGTGTEYKNVSYIVRLQAPRRLRMVRTRKTLGLGCSSVKMIGVCARLADDMCRKAAVKRATLLVQIDEGAKTRV
jgi:hypothetical protein